MGRISPVRDWIRQNGSKYHKNSEIADACVAALGARRKTVLNALSDIKTNTNGKAAVASLSACELRIGNLGLSEQELRSKHDALYKLEQAVKALSPGKFIPEPEFRATVSIDPSKFRSKSDLPQFDAYRGRVAGLTYWGHPKDIKRLKDEGVLQ